jgi:hypothetical protein
MIRLAVAATIVLTLVSIADAATVLFKSYQAPRDEAAQTFNKLYFDGVREGILEFNAYLEANGKNKVFCPPGKLAITTDQAEDIMKREARTVANADSYPIALLLMAGFIHTFPCDANK